MRLEAVLLSGTLAAGAFAAVVPRDRAALFRRLYIPGDNADPAITPKNPDGVPDVVPPGQTYSPFIPAVPAQPVEPPTEVDDAPPAQSSGVPIVPIVPGGGPVPPSSSNPGPPPGPPPSPPGSGSNPEPPPGPPPSPPGSGSNPEPPPGPPPLSPPSISFPGPLPGPPSPPPPPPPPPGPPPGPPPSPPSPQNPKPKEECPAQKPKCADCNGKDELCLDPPNQGCPCEKESTCPKGKDLPEYKDVKCKSEDGEECTLDPLKDCKCTGSFRVWAHDLNQALLAEKAEFLSELKAFEDGGSSPSPPQTEPVAPDNKFRIHIHEQMSQKEDSEESDSEVRWTLFTSQSDKELATGTGPSLTTDPLLTRTVEIFVKDPTTTDSSIRFNYGDVEWLDSEGPDPNDPNRPSCDQNGRNTWKPWRKGFERDFDCVFIDHEAPKSDAPADAPDNPTPNAPENAPPSTPAPAGPCRSDSDCGGMTCDGGSAKCAPAGMRQSTGVCQC